MRRSMRCVVPPVGEPISLEEAREQVRVLDSDSDGYLSARIRAARQHVEARLNVVLMPSTWELALDRFPGGELLADGRRRMSWEVGAQSSVRRRGIEIPLAPVTGVEWVKYLDDGGVERTVPAGHYRLLLERPAVVVPSREGGWVWPPAGAEAGAVTVRVTAGFGSAAEVPGPVKDYMLLLIGAMFENRALEVTGTITSRLGFAADLLNEWRVYA